jgi:aspartate-semialdehyde dehydrogenase
MKKNAKKASFKKFVSPVTVAVVGAGMVGKEMIRILEERKFPAKEIRVLARSARVMELDGKKYQVYETTPDAFNGVDIALFAGTEGEKGAAVTFGKEAIKRGAVLIDNGADFRMDPKVPLVIPEVNPEDVMWNSGIIANPNCTTAVMMMPVAPLHKKFGVKRVIVSTYQAVSGAGGKAIEELRDQSQEHINTGKVTDAGMFPDPIAFNVLAHNWKIEGEGYSNEEWKAIKETRKILHDDSIQVIPTTVRVPVFNAHSESIYVELKKKATLAEVRKVLSKAAGVRVVDAKSPLDGKIHPMPSQASGKDDVLVGRLRRDLENPKGFLMFAAGDNLRKGAALNAVQIAECLIQK